MTETLRHTRYFTPNATVRVAQPGSPPAQADVLVVPIAEGDGADGDGAGGAGSAPRLLTGTAGGIDGRDLQRLGATGALGEVTRVLSTDSRAPVIAAVGLGKVAAAPSPAALRRAAGAVARALTGMGNVAVELVDERSSPDQVRATVEGLILGSYSFTALRSAKTLNAGSGDPLAFTLVTPPSPHVEAAVRAGRTAAEAVNQCRDLVNIPAADLGPQQFAELATELACAAGVDIETLDPNDLNAGGFGGISAVGMGSERGPRLIRLEWAPSAARSTVALVGKGITFDSGGLSLKPADQMLDMKSDMAGAAAVLSTVLAAAAAELPVRVVAWCPVAENMPSGRAVRPGDVVTHYNGTTVEVVNTDAEGRLVLADALARAAEDAPDLIVDAATLTGSSTIALGRHTYAVFGTDQARGDVIRAAAAAGESAWELPLQDELRADLKSTTADMCNYSAQGGGAITAALFLREFVPDGIEWSHLDVAGPAWNEGAAAFHNPEGATGVPVRTLLRLLEARAR